MSKEGENKMDGVEFVPTNINKKNKKQVEISTHVILENRRKFVDFNK